VNNEIVPIFLCICIVCNDRNNIVKDMFR